MPLLYTKGKGTLDVPNGRENTWNVMIREISNSHINMRISTYMEVELNPEREKGASVSIAGKASSWIKLLVLII